MADRYWVGGTGSYTDTAHWSTTSGGSGGASVPISSDNVFFNGSSGLATTGIVTVIGDFECNNIDFSGTSVDFFQNGAKLRLSNDGTTYTIYGSFTAGGMQIVVGSGTVSTKQLIFASSSLNTPISAITSSRINAYTYFNGTGSWILTGNCKFETRIYLIQGYIDTQGFEFSPTQFETDGTLPRGLNLNNSTINTLSTWKILDTTNFTFDSGTSNFTDLQIFMGAGLTYYNVTFTGGYNTINGSNTFNNLIITPNTGGNYTSFIEENTTQTVNGSLTIDAGAITNPPQLLRTGTFLNITANSITDDIEFSNFSHATGSTATIAVNTVSLLRNIDFMDITITGSSAPYAGTNLGDALGNSGITFDAPVTRYWVGGTGSWRSTSEWSTSSGGASGASYPRCHDIAIFDSNSFSGAGQIVSSNLTCLPTMDWSTVTNNPTFKFLNNSESQNNYLFGNQTFKSGMTISASTRGTIIEFTLYFASRSSVTFNQDGATVSGINNGSGFIDIDMPGGTLTLLSNLNFPLDGTSNTRSGFFRVNRGTFDANDFNITTTRFSSNNTNVRSILMGNGIWTLNKGDNNNSDYTWDTTDITNLTFLSENSTLTFTGNSIAFILIGGGLNFNNFSISGNSTSTCKIYSDNTFNVFTITPPIGTISFNENSTQTISSFISNGTISNNIVLRTLGTFGIITSLSIVDGGLGYTAGDDVTIIGESTSASYNIDSVDGNGTVTGLTQLNAGTNYISGVHNTSSNTNYAGKVIGGSIVAAGSGYQVGEQVYVSPGAGDPSAFGAVFEVLTIGGSGEVTSIDLVIGEQGQDYVTGVHNTEPFSSIEGQILSATISNGGSGYTAGDYLYVVPGAGDPTASDGYFLITSVDGGGAITGISLDFPGSLYIDGIHDVSPIDFGGSSAQIDLTVAHDGTGLTIDIDVNTFQMLTVDIVASTIEASIYADSTSISYVDVQNNHALGNITFQNYPGGTDSGNNTNWCFNLVCPPNLPDFNPSIITVVKKINQNIQFPQFVIAGQGGANEDEYSLFKKDNNQLFNLWRSKVFNVGKKFEIVKIVFSLIQDLDANTSITPKLYFDNERNTSVGTTINTSSYTNDNKLIELTPKDFTDTVFGEQNFFLEFQFTGSTLGVIGLPITIMIEEYDQ